MKFYILFCFVAPPFRTTETNSTTNKERSYSRLIALSVAGMSAVELAKLRRHYNALISCIKVIDDCAMV